MQLITWCIISPTCRHTLYFKLMVETAQYFWCRWYKYTAAPSFLWYIIIRIVLDFGSGKSGIPLFVGNPAQSDSGQISSGSQREIYPFQSPSLLSFPSPGPLPDRLAFSHPLPHLLYLPLSSPCPPFPFLPLEVGTLKSSRGLGSAVNELTQWGLGRSHSRNRIWCILAWIYDIWWQHFNHFAENQLTIFSARDAGDFNDAAGEREMAPKCRSLPRDAGDLAGLWQYIQFKLMRMTCHVVYLSF